MCARLFFPYSDYELRFFTRLRTNWNRAVHLSSIVECGVIGIRYYCCISVYFVYLFVYLLITGFVRTLLHSISIAKVCTLPQSK